MSNTKSFQFADPEHITPAKERVHFNHVTVCRASAEPRVRGIRRAIQKSGCESWSCQWAPDGSYLAWSAGHRIVHLIPWDSRRQRRHDPSDRKGLAGREFHVLDCGELVHSMAFGLSTNNKHKQRWKRQRADAGSALVLVTGHFSGRMKLWNCETGHLVLEMMDHKDVIHDLHFTPDQRDLRLASASRDGTVKLWEFDDSGESNLYLTIKTNTKHAFGCRWSPDRKHVAVVGNFKTVLLFSVEYRQVTGRQRLEGHHHDVVQCDFSPDGALLATASFDSRIIVWDACTYTQLAQLGHLYPSPRPIYAGGANDHYVYSVKFSPEGTRIASVAEDGYVRVWQWPDLSDPVSIGSVDGARYCSFSADGQLLAVGTSGGSLSVLSTPRGAVVPLSHACRSVIRKMVSTPDLPSLPLPPYLHRYLAYRENYLEEEE